jgi:hypothetical protein
MKYKNMPRLCTKLYWIKYQDAEKTEHEAKLCLARYESCEEPGSEIGFDMLFSTHTPRWQESKIAMVVKT